MSKNKNLAREIQELKRALLSKKQEIDRLHGRLQGIDEMLLEKTGVNDIGKVEDYIKSLEKKLGKQSRELQKKLDKFEQDYPALIEK
jgi:predicted RNase H-like nuclease (RuvC/YqgF family)